MRILQPAEWSKPRGFSHGVEVDGPGRWIVLAGQTGGDEKGEYQPNMAAQVGTAEPDAEISRCWFECEIDLVAGVKTDPDARNLTTKCTLCVH